MTLTLSLFLLFSVRGVVVDPQGKPVEGAVVSCGSSTTSTSAGGAFEAAAACDATVRKLGFADAKLKLADGDNRVELRLTSTSDRVVVSATGSPLAVEESGVSVTIFTAEDLARKNSPFVTELLRDAPGLAVVQTGQAGQLTSLFSRGAGSSSAMVLLDGIPLTEPGGSLDWTHLSVPGLDRIEVVRGPSSALFGAEASSGVVQLYTHAADPESLAHGFAAYERGSFSTDHWTASLGGGLAKKLDYSLTGDQYRSTGEYVNDAFRMTTGTASVGYALSNVTRLRGVVRSFDAYTGAPGQTYYGLFNLDARSTDRDVATGLKLDDIRGTRYTQSATFAYHRYHDVFDDPLSESYLLRGIKITVFSGAGETLTHRISSGYRGSLAHGRGTLTFGYEFENQAGTISKKEVNRQDNGFYAHEQYSVNRWMSFTAGLRVQHSSRFGTETAPRGTVTFRLPTSTFFHVSVGRGVKEPLLLENYAREAFYVGNPALRPEVTNSFETGLYREWFGSRVLTDVVYFRNQFENLIQFDFSKSPATWSNIDNSWARGVEISASAKLVRGLTLRTNYTNLHTHSSKAIELLRRPRNSGSVALDFNPKKFDFQIGARFIGERQDNDFVFGITRNTGYATAYLNASWRASAHVAPFLRIGNLNNERYQEALGYTALSRMTFGGVKLSW